MDSLPKLILASASPRRSELLRVLGLQFEVIASDATELHDVKLTVAELCKVNAARKAESIAEKFPEALVLGADTLVTLDGETYGKPQSIQEAHQMLGCLQGRTHQVITGVALVR